MSYGINYNDKKTIHVYSVCYNEEIMLPYFLKHYSKFVDKITIYDNFSTDNSVEIIKKYSGVEIIPFNTNNECAEEELTNLRNNCWKGSTCDWVIVCDIDEIIYHPYLLDKLYEISDNGYSIIKTVGCQMISETLPSTHYQIYNELKMGFYDIMYSKPCILNPNKVTELNLTYGSHFLVEPKGEINIFYSSDIKLLHYKHISREYETNKNSENSIRMSEFSRNKGLGSNIHEGNKGVNKYFNENISNTINIVDADIKSFYNIHRMDINFGVYYKDGKVWIFTHTKIDTVINFYDINDNILYSTTTKFIPGPHFWYLFRYPDNIKIVILDMGNNIIQEKFLKI